MNLQEILDSISTRITALEARRQQERFITLQLPNGEEVTAPTGIWFLSLAAVMDEDQRTKLIEKLMAVQKEHVDKNQLFSGTTKPMPTMQERMGEVVHTDFTVDKAGKKHYTMKCESGKIGTKW